MDGISFGGREFAAVKIDSDGREIWRWQVKWLGSIRVNDFGAACRVPLGWHYELHMHRQFTSEIRPQLETVVRPINMQSETWIEKNGFQSFVFPTGFLNRFPS